MTLETHEIRTFGVPLRDAVLKFASADLLEELEAALTPISPPAMDEQKPILSIINSLAHASQMPQLLRAKAERERQVHAALREHLKYWLEAGELVGCGCQVSPTPVRVPRKIQPDFWRNAEIDWEREIAEDAERVYQRILILDPEDFPGRDLFPGMGPKYFAVEIRAAMIGLDRELPNFRSSEMAHKVRAIEVRKWINRRYPKLNTGGRGFDVDTIRRHYKRYCNSIQSNS